MKAPSTRYPSKTKAAQEKASYVYEDKGEVNYGRWNLRYFWKRNCRRWRQRRLEW